MKTRYSYLNLYFLSFTFLFLLVTSFVLNEQYIMHADNAFLLHATKLLLLKKNYLNGFVDPNPPLIFVLYLPVFAIKKLLNVTLVNAFNTYITSLSFFSILLCYKVLTVIFDNTKIQNFLLFIILSVVLFLPFGSYGQREHLLLLFTLPYILTIIAHMENKSISMSLAILAGVIAGLGFSLKPYFFVLLMGAELVLLIQKRSMWSWARTETICIIGIIISYILFISFFFPDYLSFIVPLAKKYYTLMPFSTLFNIYSLHILLVVALALYLLRNAVYFYPLLALTIATCGLFIAYLLSGQNFYYHQLPAYSLSILLAATCFLEIFFRLKTITNPNKLIHLTFTWLVVSILIFFHFTYYITYLKFLNALLLESSMLTFAIASLVLILYSVNRLFSSDWLKLSCILAVTICYFFSANPFGQQEQLILFAILPYFFHYTQRLTKPNVLNLHGLFVSLFLAIACILNPLLLLLFVLLELYLISKTKNLRLLLQSPLIIVVLIQITYSLFLHLSLFQRMNGFFHNVEIYYLYLTVIENKSAQAHFENINIIFSFFTFVISLLYIKQSTFKLCQQVLTFSLAFFIILSMKELHSSYFSTLIAFNLSCILLVMILIDRLLRPINNIGFIPTTKSMILVLAFLSLLANDGMLTLLGTKNNIQESKSENATALINYFKDKHGTYDYIARSDEPIIIELYTKLQFTGLLPLIWTWPYKSYEDLFDKNKQKIMQRKHDETLFINTFASTLQKNLPEFLVFEREYKKTCNVKFSSTDLTKLHAIENIINTFKCKPAPTKNPILIKAFIRNPNFLKVWAKYHYVEAINEYLIYKRNA